MSACQKVFSVVKPLPPKKNLKGTTVVDLFLCQMVPCRRVDCLNHSGWIVLLNLKLIALLLGAGSAIPLISLNVSIIPSFQWCQRSDRSDQSHPNDVISTSPLLVLVTHKLGWKPPAGSLDHPTGEIWKTLVFMNTSTKYSTSQVQDWVIACTYGILWGSKLHNFG